MKTNLEIAKEVINGQWGNGKDRINRLAKAGYNYKDVQAIVNTLLNGSVTEEQSANIPVITGNKTLEVTVNLSEYSAIKLNFEVGNG